MIIKQGQPIPPQTRPGSKHKLRLLAVGDSTVTTRSGVQCAYQLAKREPHNFKFTAERVVKGQDRWKVTRVEVSNDEHS